MREGQRHKALRSVAVLAAAVTLMLMGAGCGEEDVEQALGQATVASIESGYDIDGDPLINQWVSLAGQTLVSHSRRQSIPYRFQVIETDMVNAFAVPYGHIYVTQGLLDFAQTEDEVWVVLGHEIGHVVARHSIHSLKRSLLWGILTQIIRGESQTLGDVVGIGLGLLSLRYSRVDEYEADDAGTLLAYRAGYDPHAGITFFKRLMTEIEKRRPASWEVYFMSHPPTEQRIQRQLKRAELDATRAETLVQIGRGYLLRGQTARAERYLAQAIQVAPDADVAASLLGDALAARGEYVLARAHYAAANSDYAARRLAALAALPPPTLAGIDADGQARAAELLTQVAGARASMAQTRASAEKYRAQTRSDLQGLIDGAKNIHGRLIDLADLEADLAEETEKLVMQANSAIARAVEPVYALEKVNKSLDELGPGVEELLGECETALRAAQAGRGNPQDVPALGRAIAELKLASATLDMAMAEAARTIEQVRTAQSAADDLTGLMELTVQRKEPDRLLADQLRTATHNTQQLGVDALQAAKKARREAVKAQGHALVARLNLLGTAATPQLQALYDRQIAHLLLVPEAAVRALRAQGVGYGEAAMSIASGQSVGTDPGRFLSGVTQAAGLVGAAEQAGAALENANVLLKFLAAAMAAEREAAREG
ncbi:MAG: M48 family metalloprotease [Armatimonadota bacterium]